MSRDLSCNIPRACSAVEAILPSEDIQIIGCSPASDATVDAAAVKSNLVASSTAPATEPSSCPPVESLGTESRDLVAVVSEGKTPRGKYYTLQDSIGDGKLCNSATAGLEIQGDEDPTVGWVPPSESFALHVKTGKLCGGDLRDMYVEKHCDG